MLAASGLLTADGFGETSVCHTSKKTKSVRESVVGGGYRRMRFAAVALSVPATGNTQPLTTAMSPGEASSTMFTVAGGAKKNWLAYRESVR